MRGCHCARNVIATPPRHQSQPAHPIVSSLRMATEWQIRRALETGEEWPRSGGRDESSGGRTPHDITTRKTEYQRASPNPIIQRTMNVSICPSVLDFHPRRQCIQRNGRLINL